MKKKDNNLVFFGIVGAVLLALLLVIIPTSSAKLSGKDFIEKYKTTPSAVLIDVRTPEEFKSGHIPTAINIDYENQSFVSEIKKLDTSKTYFVYCRSGNRSGKSIAIMKSNGFNNIYELKGGILSAPELLQ